VLTHAHSDHVTGLIEVLRRYDVQRILEREVEYASPSYQEWRHAVEAEGADVIRAQAGQVIAFDNGVLMQVLNPPDHLLRGTASDIDNASVVLRLVYGESSFLLTGDAFSESERIMTAQGVSIDSDVLKVAHHGSRSSSTEDFIAIVSPAVAVISAGKENRFDHPHAETIEILRQYVPEELLFLTADNGTIEFITDGSSLKIKTE
jgi:beta-lactamase superfamily II metal-dependent hydrolase